MQPVYRQVRTESGMYVEVLLRDGTYQRIAFCSRPQPQPHYH